MQTSGANSCPDYRIVQQLHVDITEEELPLPMSGSLSRCCECKCLCTTVVEANKIVKSGSSVCPTRSVKEHHPILVRELHAVNRGSGEAFYANDANRTRRSPSCIPQIWTAVLHRLYGSSEDSFGNEWTSIKFSLSNGGRRVPPNRTLEIRGC